MFGRLIRYAGAQALFAADFYPASPGSMSAATFLSTYGLEYVRTVNSRSSGTTVQTSASAIESGIGADRPCIGSLGTAVHGLVVQNNVSNTLGTAGSNAPRDLNVDWSAGSSTTVTSNFSATSPNGESSKCSRAATSSLGYSPFAAFGNSKPQTITSWQRSKDATVDGDMMQIWNNASPAVATVEVRLATNTWGRLTTISPGSVYDGFAVQDCRDYTGVGGQSARARDTLVDFIQREVGLYSTEVVSGISQDARYSDRVTHPTASALVDGGRVTLYARFYPKFTASTNPENAVYQFGTADPNWYIWNVDSTHALYFRGPGSSPVMVLEGIVGATTGHSTNTFSWTKLDDVEIFVEMGGSIASSASYRKNGGAWSDLAFTTTFGSISPGAGVKMGIFWNSTVSLPDTNGGGQPPMWLREIRFLKSGAARPS